MKEVYFTADNGKYSDVVERLKLRFERLNGAELRIIRPQAYHALGIEQPYWVKAYMWELAADADRVGWVDADMVPRIPLGQLPTDGFCVAPDVPCTVTMAREVYQHPFDLGYFNAGFVVAHRDTQPMFEAWKAYMKDWPNDKKMYWVEQTWMNKLLHADRNIKLHVLAQEYNWMVGDYHANVVMQHFAGFPLDKPLLRQLWDELEGPRSAA